MFDRLLSRPLLRVAVLVVGVLAALAGVRLVANLVGAEAEVTRGAGTLTVGGITYAFTPTTCFISDADFVAAGPGSDGSDRYWVSASSVSLDLTVGTENEIDEPDDDQLWLVSDDSVEWRATGQTVVASASMNDRRSPGTTAVVGSLELTCDPGA